MATTNSRPPRDRSRLTSLHTTEPDGGPYEVHADCQVTRRKRHHMVTGANGQVVFRSRIFGDIIDWLHGEGQDRYRLHTDRGSYRVTAERDAKQRRAE